MKKVIKLGLLLLAMVVINTGLEAQQFGFLNSGVILAQMPEVQQMNANLEALGKQLQKKGQGMVASYKAKEESAMRKKEQGEMSPLEEQTVLEELQKSQDDILKFEKEMQKNLAEKEQELLKPIYDKINTAIEAVAKENGFTMIFDAGVLLWAEDGADVSDKVKAKLGM